MTESLTPNLFDWHAAQMERDAAIDRVEMSTSAWWMNRAMNAIRSCAAEGGDFTTDDVWKLVGDSPGVEGRAMGAAMTRAQRDGVIVPTDRYRNSEQVSCHGRPKRLWRRA